MDNYHTLIFEGGGIKGYAYPSALETLIEDKFLDLDFIDRYVGTSAGAIIAGLLACGADMDFLNYALGVDFRLFQDDTTGPFRDLLRVYRKWGYYRGDFFSDWYSNMLEELTGDGLVCMGELQRKLCIVATDVNGAKMKLFTNKDTPHIPVALAVRASISLPGVFVPVRINDVLYVDGGLLANYYDPKGNSGELGFRLVSNKDRQEFVSISNLTGYGSRLVDVFMLSNERNHISKTLWDNTINIDTGDIPATLFNLSPKQKDFLKNNAISAAKKFISRKRPTYEFMR